jgi:hypothetical protein
MKKTLNQNQEGDIEIHILIPIDVFIPNSIYQKLSIHYIID